MSDTNTLHILMGRVAIDKGEFVRLVMECTCGCKWGTDVRPEDIEDVIEHESKLHREAARSGRLVLQ